MTVSFALSLFLSACGSPPEPGPLLSVTPEKLEFGPLDETALFYVENRGGGRLDFEITKGEKADGMDWLKVEPDSGSLEAGTGKAFLVTVIGRENRAPGSYLGELLFIVEGKAPFGLQVAMEVGKPVLSVGPADLIDFGSTSDVEKLIIANNGTAPLIYTIDLPEEWLSTESDLFGQLPPEGTHSLKLHVDRDAVPWYGKGTAELSVSSNGHEDKSHSPVAVIQVIVTVDPGCSLDLDCVKEGYYCDTSGDSGVCALKREPGESCQSPSECSSGYCADGTCCNSACAGQCFSCVGQGSEGSCLPLDNGDECSDGLACTQFDTCVDGDCVAGAPMDCSELDSDCSSGACDEETGGCVEIPLEDLCVIIGQCVAEGTLHPDIPCLSCRPSLSGTDWSAAEGTCFIEGSCYDIGDPVGGDCLVCNPAFPYEPYSVADDTPCTADESICTADKCVGGECSHPPLNGAACDDGNDCTSDDQCADGACAGKPYSCDDGLECTTESCDGDGACAGSIQNGYCVIDGMCVEVGTVVPDTGGCMACIPGLSETGWSPDNGVLCDDGDPCTLLDHCVAGECVGTPLNCDDDLSCTDDSCLDGECVHPVSEGTCLIDSACRAAGFSPPADPCVACVPAESQTAWSATKEGLSCDDGLYCTVDETCNSGICNGTPRDCGETECIYAWCIEAEDVCVTNPVDNGTACDDGNACTLEDQCTDTECIGVPKDCSYLVQDDPCMNATCIPDSQPEPGKCVTSLKLKGTPCNDGLACTEDTTCQAAGTCAAGYEHTPESCSDLLDNGNPCYIGACAEPDGCYLVQLADSTSCSIPNAFGICNGGYCQFVKCQESFGDCNLDMEDGCEADIFASLEHCGECGASCKYFNAWTQCSTGQCNFIGCAVGYTDCDDDLETGCEANTGTDAENCGSCGFICETTNAAKVGVCWNSMCNYEVCTAGTWNLDGQPGNGCECTITGPEKCNSIDDDCNGKVDEGFDLLADDENCGECGNACTAEDHVAEVACQQGECIITACQEDFLDKNGYAQDGCEEEILFAGQLWVDASNAGDPDEDGTEEHPFDAIQEALDAADADYLVHVSEGNYVGGVTIDKEELKLVGAGSSLVTIDAAGDDSGILVVADDVTVMKLTVSGAQYGVHFKSGSMEKLDSGMLTSVVVKQIAAPGEEGGWGVGVFIENAQNVTISSVKVSDVKGGTGKAPDDDYGGKGGSAVGILFSWADDCRAMANLLVDLTGGTGGLGAPTKTSGAGGVAAGIYMSNSNSSTVFGNTVDFVSGGLGGNGMPDVTGGEGGVAAGVYLSGSTNCSVAGNTILGLFGGKGSYAGDPDPGLSGRDQEAFGIYLTDSALDNNVTLTNTVEGEPIAYLYGADKGAFTGLVLTSAANPTNLGKIVALESSNVTIQGNVVKNFKGESGESGKSQKSGEPGEMGIGIRLEKCVNCVVADNKVSDIVGGEGGTAGFNSWHLATGGRGGLGIGVYADEGTSCRIKRNTVLSITGGSGGGPWDDWEGVGGQAAAFWMTNSADTTFTHNIAAIVNEGEGNPVCESKADCVWLNDMPATAVAHLTCHDIGGECGAGHAVAIGEDQWEPVQVVNSIIYETTGACLHSDALGPGLLAAEYSDLYECDKGQAFNSNVSWTCISTKPEFENAPDGDFHLKPKSPCIDVGSPAFSCNAEPVPNGCLINIGAYGNTEEAASSQGAGHCEVCPTL